MVILRKMIEDYVIEHENQVTFSEVKRYVLDENHIDTNENSIRVTLSKVLKRTNGRIKREGLQQMIHDYVIKHNGEVTFSEVKRYVLEEKHINTTKESVCSALSRVRKSIRETK